MIIRLTIISITMLAIFAISYGCRDHHGGMMSTNGIAENVVLRVYPVDGSTDVPPSTTVAVKFSRKMDSVSVMKNLHIVVGGEMYIWMDTIEIAGTYRWNDAMDSCEFMPTAGMDINQEHMIFMDERGMMQHHDVMMGSNHNDEQYHFYHFITGK